MLLNVYRLILMRNTFAEKVDINFCVQKHVNKYIKLPSISVDFHLSRRVKMADKKHYSMWNEGVEKINLKIEDI